MTRSQFYVDGEPLNLRGPGGPVRWVTDEQTLHGPGAVSSAQVRLPGMDGELSLPSTRTTGASTWALSMGVTGRTYEEMLTNKHNLERLLKPHNRDVTITEVLPSGETITARGYVDGEPTIDRPWDSDSDGFFATYVFRIPTGVWLGPEVTTQITGAGMASVATGALGGSAPMYETRLTVTGSDVYFQVSSGGDPNAYIAYIGDTGGGATIWPKAVFATNGAGTNVSTNLSTGTRTFHVPADGIFRVDHFSGVTSATITTRKAYY